MDVKLKKNAECLVRQHFPGAADVLRGDVGQGLASVRKIKEGLVTTDLFAFLILTFSRTMALASADSYSDRR